MEVIEGFKNLKLEKLPDEWVDHLWSTNFVEPKLPEEFELMFDCSQYSKDMNNLADAIHQWNKDDNESPTTSSDSYYKKSCYTLIDNKIKLKSLVALISCFINKTIKDLPYEERAITYSCAKLYFSLMSIKDAKALNIFNVILFEQVVGLLKDSTQIHFSTEWDSEGIERETEEKHELVNDDVLREVCSLMNGLYICLKELHLENEIDLSIIIRVLVNLTQLEIVYTNCIFEFPPESNTLQFIVRKAYAVLELLCDPVHGDVKQVVKYMLNQFLLTLQIDEEVTEASDLSKISSRDNTLKFISYLVMTSKDESIYTYTKALLQQLCIRKPQKADIRVVVVHNIFHVMLVYPYSHFIHMTKWIVSLAHTEGSDNRLFALELISKHLEFSNNLYTPEEHKNETYFDYGPSILGALSKRKLMLYLEFLIGAVLSRMRDKCPLVRSKSLNIFTPLMLSRTIEFKKIMEDLFVKDFECYQLTAPNNNDHSFNFAQYLYIDEPLKLFPENCLPSGHYIMELTEILCLNKKISVRKNALQLLCNACTLNIYWFSGARVKIIINSCRDASVLIRKTMMKNVTDLLLLDPSNKILIRAWVEGVLPSIADSDVKCQEKVFEYAKNVILDRLTTDFNTVAPYQKLPLEILNMIAIADKRIQFQFICKAWSKNKYLTKDLVETLVTHVMTKYEFAAWFFIVCISEIEDISQPRFVVDYFFTDVIHQKTVVQKKLHMPQHDLNPVRRLHEFRPYSIQFDPTLLVY